VVECSESPVMLFKMPATDTVEYKFNMRDNLAFQIFQSLIEAGRATSDRAAGLAVDAYDLADAFIVQTIHEKREGK